VLEGREFSQRDQHREPGKEQTLPVVINQRAARAFFASDDPVGRRIVDGSKSYEVVGVAKDLSAPLSQTAVGQSAAFVPVVYLPLTRTDFARPPGNGMIVMIRSDHGADAMAGVRRKLSEIDPAVVVFDVRTLSSQIADTMAYLHLGEYIYGSMGLFGLVLSTIGLAGVTAYSVARRRKEIGIRMALGARPGQVLGLVLREGGSLILSGCVLGWLAASAISRVVIGFSSILGPSFAAGAHDLRVFIGGPALLASLAMLACYLPARRSTRIDPLKTLREE
jgi:ABC-type antimicrobial peptide transport system permease subunit